MRIVGIPARTAVRIDATAGKIDARTDATGRRTVARNGATVAMTGATTAATGVKIAGIGARTGGMTDARPVGIAASTVSSASVGTAINGVGNGIAVIAPTGGVAISGSAAIQA